MHIKHTDEQGVAVLRLHGKIMGGPDATSLHEKLHELIDSGNLSVVVDLTEVDWMNSSGLGILIGGLSALRKSGGDLRLSSATEKIEEVLRITKLDRVFTVYENTSEAIDSYSS